MNAFTFRGGKVKNTCIQSSQKYQSKFKTIAALCCGKGFHNPTSRKGRAVLYHPGISPRLFMILPALNFFGRNTAKTRSNMQPWHTMLPSQQAQCWQFQTLRIVFDPSATKWRSSLSNDLLLFTQKTAVFKRKPKAITQAYHKERKQTSEPVRTRSDCMQPTQSAGKRVRASRDESGLVLVSLLIG